MYFLRDGFTLSAVYLVSRQRQDILDFAYCPLLRVLHATLIFGQCANIFNDLSVIGGHYDVRLVDDRSTSRLIYYLLQHRVDENQLGRSSCSQWQFLAFSS